MHIIDAHMHYSRIASFFHCAEHTSGVAYSEAGFLKETKENGIAASVCMGLSESAPASFPDAGAATPMPADLSEKLPSNIFLCPGINPHTLTPRGVDALEAFIKDCGRVVGIKIYAGYYHVDIFDPVFDPVYALAAKYDLTIAVHTGETYSDRGLLTYSHPLHADRLAVRYPNVRFVLCHMGVPWIFDACGLACKNPNIYIDLSGLLVGSAATLERMAAQPLLVDRYRQALVFLDSYDKIMFGTDWPLAPMGAYIEFIKRLVPPEQYERVFYQNALNIYKLHDMIGKE
jgi:hypothetical protein